MYLNFDIHCLHFLLLNSEMDQMKERFAKLLLGEDMSGGGKGVSSALALSNAITNHAGEFIVISLILFVSCYQSMLVIMVIKTLNIY